MIDKKLTEDEAKSLLDVEIPGAVNINNAPFVLSAEIDTTPQPLKKIKPYVRAVGSIPSFLPTQGAIVLRLLFDCFEKQGSVKEGLIGDLLWGFSQSPCIVVNGKAIPCPPEATWEGLRVLHKYGYIKFQAPDGEFIEEHSTKLAKAWVRYEPKLLEMIYE